MHGHSDTFSNYLKFTVKSLKCPYLGFMSGHFIIFLLIVWNVCASHWDSLYWVVMEPWSMKQGFSVFFILDSAFIMNTSGRLLRNLDLTRGIPWHDYRSVRTGQTKSCGVYPPASSQFTSDLYSVYTFNTFKFWLEFFRGIYLGLLSLEYSMNHKLISSLMLLRVYICD